MMELIFALEIISMLVMIVSIAYGAWLLYQKNKDN